MDLIGYVATVLTIAAFIPQTYKAVKTRRTKDLSLATYATLIITGTLWTIYGIGLKDPAIYITNSVIGTAALIICGVKLSTDKRSQ